jgi:tetratricopeptide (TPR) repeat protein
MNHLRTAVGLVLLTSVVLHAQTPAPKSQPDKNRSSASAKDDPELIQRRSVALSALESLAIEARSYRDEPLRARVQARVADAIWDQNPEAARTLFRRAWEVAETLETNAPSTSPTMPGRMPAGRTPPRPRANLRREVLQLVAKRDRQLGEELLKRMTPKDDVARTIDASSRSANLSSQEIAERIRLARSFLGDGNLQRALEFADPALVQANTDTIGFLISLYEKNPAAADQRFASLLAMAAADSSSDANTVSFLTTYAFTPSIVLVVSQEGIPSSMSYPSHPPPALSPQLRKAFFQTSANILLRPLAQIEQSSAGRGGTYFMITRLLPLFQQFAPDLAPALSAQLAALGPEAGRRTAEFGDRGVNRGMNDNGKPGSFEDDWKDRLDRARTSDERDKAYAHAAFTAADQGDPRASDFVDKIEDTETRDGVRKFVDYNFIRSLLQKKRAEEALNRLRKADLPHTLRAHFLTQAGALFNEKDRVRANELLEEALTETRRIDAATPDRAYCLVALLSQFSKTNKARVWELLSETVKAANAVPDFTGEYGQTSLNLEGKFSIRLGTELATPTALSEVFANLAEDNFYQALDAARGFSGEAPRALSMISVTRAMFEKKPNQSAKRDNQ